MKRQVFQLLFLLIVMGGCSWIHGSPPYSEKDYQARIEGFIAGENFEEALTEATRALQYYPREGFFHLRKGELSAVLGKTRSALRVYKKALRLLNKDDHWYLLITHRNGLLLALERTDLDAAREMLSDLPEDTPGAIDLRGVIALKEGKGREALEIFNESAGRGLDKEDASRISLHAAMAYHLLGDLDKARQSLYGAVNLAGMTLMIPQIEAFWEVIKEADPAYDGG